MDKTKYLLIPFLFSVAGCGGGSSSTSQMSITVQGPPSGTVLLGQTAQFTVVVENSANSSVTWQVNAIAGGNASVGTISTTGLYTAPTTIPSMNQIQITALSTANPSVSGSATITLSSNITVSISPQSPAIFAGQTQQFTVFVNNAINVAVTWEVNGVAGGSSSTGTISSTGLYSAPATVSSALNVTVSAVSVADPSKSGPSTITINPHLSVSVSPLVATVLVGHTLQFSATVQNTANQSVTWQIVIQPQVGTISSSGLYSAPASISAPVFVQVTATSIVDPLGSGTAWIIVNTPGPNNAALKGQYAFNLTSQCGSCASDHFVLEAGSIVADGAGNITSGVTEWINDGGSSMPQNVIGAYSILANNQGDVLFLSLAGGRAQVYGLHFALGSLNKGIASRAHVNNMNAGNGTGTMLLQDVAACSSSAILGNYVFGPFVGTPNVAAAGLFHADGAGNLGGGLLDVNDPFLSLSEAPFTGTYNVDAVSCRGTATLNISTLGAGSVVFYVISAKELLWLGTLSNAQWFTGSALQQSGGPFSSASLNGTNVMALEGAAAASNVNYNAQSAGIVTADGHGNLTGTVDGIVDTSGNILSNQPWNGTYTLSANGRGTMNIFNQTFVIYLADQNTAYILEAPNNIQIQTGLIEPQAGSPFSESSISGAFTSGGNSTLLDQTIGFTTSNLFGTFSSDGAGNISGSFSSPEISGSFSAYTVSTNGRGTITATVAGHQQQLVLYMISPNAFVVLDNSLSFFGP